MSVVVHSTCLPKPLPSLPPTWRSRPDCWLVVFAGRPPYLEDVGEFALTVGDVAGISPTKGHDTLLQVAQRLVYVHALLLDSFVRYGSSF